jgi:hypothetical protein
MVSIKLRMIPVVFNPLQICKTNLCARTGKTRPHADLSPCIVLHKQNDGDELANLNAGTKARV